MWLPGEGTVMARESEARRRDTLSAISRELGAMSDWELERGLQHPSASMTTEGWWLTASCGTDMPGQSAASLSGYWR